MMIIRIFIIITILFFSTQAVQAKTCYFWGVYCTSEEGESNDGIGSDIGKNAGVNLGLNTAKELRETIKEAIPLAGGENRKTLEKLRQELDILMQSAGNLYDDKLNLTVDKLDIVTT